MTHIISFGSYPFTAIYEVAGANNAGDALDMLVDYLGITRRNMVFYRQRGRVGERWRVCSRHVYYSRKPWIVLLSWWQYTHTRNLTLIQKNTESER